MFKIYKFISTLAYSGCVKYAPGTVGTLVSLIIGLVIYYLNPQKNISNIYLFIAFISFIVGWFASSKYSQMTKKEDPKEVVIDELCGYFLTIGITLLITPNANIILATLLSFIFFRILDISKPLAVGWCDRNVKGGLGIMLDDVLAGVFASFAVIFLLILIW